MELESAQIFSLTNDAFSRLIEIMARTKYLTAPNGKSSMEIKNPKHACTNRNIQLTL